MNRHNRKRARTPGRIPLIAALGAMTFLACSGMQAPTAEIARADQAIQQAAAAGGAQHAPLEIRKAREKLENAERASRDDDYEEAHRFAAQALADARLAETKAEAAQAERNAEETREGLYTIEEESRRTTDTLEEALEGGTTR